jgi:hypothetical protein
MVPLQFLLNSSSGTMCKTLKLLWGTGDYNEYKKTWRQVEGCKWSEVSLDGGAVPGMAQQMLLLEEPRGKRYAKKGPARRWSPKRDISTAENTGALGDDPLSVL